MQSALWGELTLTCRQNNFKKKKKNLLYFLVLSFDLTPLWPNFLKRTECALTKLQCSAALMNASVQKQSQPLKSLLFLPKQKSCYLLLISSLFFCVPGEALQHGPFQQLPPNNKNIVLFYFIYFFPPLHLSGAITLPYSAYDPGAMGGGTHWPWMIMSFHTAEIFRASHFSGGGFAAIWFFVAVRQNGG